MLNIYITKISNFVFDILLHITDKLINCGQNNMTSARLLIIFNLVIFSILKYIFKTTVVIEPISFIMVLVYLQMLDFTIVRRRHIANNKNN